MKEKFKVGDTVRIKGNHPWAGHEGKVVSLDEISTTMSNRNLGPKKARVKLYDTQGHECYIMNDKDADVLK